MLEPGSPLLPPSTTRHRVYRGLLTDRQEHIFTWFAVVIVLFYVTGWIGAFAETRRQLIEEAARAAAHPKEEGAVAAPSRHVTTALLDSKAPTTAYINDAMLGFLGPLRGESGALRYTTLTPGAEIAEGGPEGASAVLEQGTSREVSPDFTAPDDPGVYKLAVQINQATRAIEDFSVVTLVPISRKRGGKIGLYYLGSWPWEGGGTPRSEAYAPPAGFIEVTPQNQDTYVSEHFRLRDFLTKDQRNVWPKYLLLNPKMIDKLELAIQDLESRGIRIDHVTVMSGFRTPRYNHSGGNTAGRANLSRHMYGDASDVFVDNDRNGNIDDLNRDGRINVQDAEVFAAAVERVERKYPSLVGGIGIYTACCGHGPFTHVDVRGFRARWRGSGNG